MGPRQHLLNALASLDDAEAAAELTLYVHGLFDMGCVGAYAPAMSSDQQQTVEGLFDGPLSLPVGPSGSGGRVMVFATTFQRDLFVRNTRGSYILDRIDAGLSARLAAPRRQQEAP